MDNLRKLYLKYEPLATYSGMSDALEHEYDIINANYQLGYIQEGSACARLKQRFSEISYNFKDHCKIVAATREVRGRHLSPLNINQRD